MRAYLPTAVAPAGRRHRSVWRTPQAVPGGPYRASRPRCRPATTPTGEPPGPPESAANWRGRPPARSHQLVASGLASPPWARRPRAAPPTGQRGSSPPPRGRRAQPPTGDRGPDPTRRTAANWPGGAPRPPAPANLRQQLVRPHRRLASRPPPPPTGPGRQPPPCPRRQQLASVRPKARPRPTNWRARAGPSKAQGPPAPVRVRGPRPPTGQRGSSPAPRGRRAPMSAPRQLAGRPRRRGRGRGARPSWDPPPSARRCRARWWEVSHTNLAKVGLTLSDS